MFLVSVSFIVGGWRYTNI